MAQMGDFVGNNAGLVQETENMADEFDLSILMTEEDKQNMEQLRLLEIQNMARPCDLLPEQFQEHKFISINIPFRFSNMEQEMKRSNRKGKYFQVARPCIRAIPLRSNRDKLFSTQGPIGIDPRDATVYTIIGNQLQQIVAKEEYEVADNNKVQTLIWTSGFKNKVMHYIDDDVIAVVLNQKKKVTFYFPTQDYIQMESELNGFNFVPVCVAVVAPATTSAVVCDPAIAGSG